MKEFVYTKESGSAILDPEGPSICGSVGDMDPVSCGGSGSCTVEVHDENSSLRPRTECHESCTPQCDTEGSVSYIEKQYSDSGGKSGSMKHSAHDKLACSKKYLGVETVTDNLEGNEVQSTNQDVLKSKSASMDAESEENCCENSRHDPTNDKDIASRTPLIQSQKDLIELNSIHINESECGQNISILHFESNQEQDITSLFDGGHPLDSGHVFEVSVDGTQSSASDLEQHAKQECSNDLKKQEEMDCESHVPKQVKEVSSIGSEKQTDQSMRESSDNQVNRNSTNEAQQTKNSSSTDMRKQTHEGGGNEGVKLEKSSSDELKMRANQVVSSADQGQIIGEITEELVKHDPEETLINELEKQAEDLCDNELDADMNDIGNDDPSEDLHTVKLGKICRICGEMTVKYDGPKKGVPKEEVVKHVKKVWNVDISNENADVYPINVCLSCERKIKRIYLKVSKRKKCELFRDKPAEFVEHSESDCRVCLLKEESPLPVLSTHSFQTSETLGGGGTLGNQGHVSKDNGKITQVQEPRRSLTRKRSREELKDAFHSVGIQTEDLASLDIITALEEHDYTQEEALKQYFTMPKKIGGRTPYQKQSLCSVNAKYIRQDRLKPLISHIDKFCQVHKEDKIDVMFFLLIQTLRDSNDRARENLVTDIWCKKNNVGVSLTDEECLAKRILLKQTKEQYRKEYCYYKDKLDKSVLKPPFIIDRLEKTYFPEHLDYFVTDGEAGPLIYQHEKSTQPSQFTITDPVDGKADGGRGSNVVGARWHYFDAVAKTLEELSCYTDIDIQELDEDTCIHVDMMDYFEEKRDMTNLHDKGGDAPGGAGGRAGQCKMMTYFFGVQSMQAVVENKVTPLYKASSATTLCRPLMKAIVSEGSAINPTYTAIEKERTAMADKVFHITLPGGTPLRFMVNFTNTTAEVRKDYRNTIGLSLSSFKKVPVVINRYGSVCLELRRSWLASSPRLVHISQVTNSRTKCSRCGEQGHNVRKCSVPSDRGRDSSAMRRRRKKQRTAPPSAYPGKPIPTLKPLSRDVKMMEVVTAPQNQHLQQQQQEHQQQQQQHQQQPQHQQPPSCPAILEASDSIGQDGAAIIRNTDQILWSCQGLSSTPGTQDTQVLIPASAPIASPVQYSSVPQRTQAGTAPVYVWAYTVVQPTSNGTQQLTPEQLSLVPQPQQSAPPLNVVQHHAAPHHTAPQPNQQMASTTRPLQQGSHSDTPQSSQQQLTVLHQQQQQTASSQHLPVMHQQQQQLQPTASQQQITVSHHQPNHPEASQPSQQHQPQQHLHVIHQQTRQAQASQSSQHLHVIHQQSQQLSSPQPLPIIHQQTSRQPTPQLPQLPQLPQKAAPQISLIPQQMSVVHQHAAAPQPSLSAVQQQQQQGAAQHQATHTHQPQMHSADAIQSQQVMHPQASSIQPVLDQNWQQQ